MRSESAVPAGRTVSIPSDFNGPVGYGNGGYSCGAFAKLVEGPAEVELRSPVPLDRELEVVEVGAEAHVMDGETLVGVVRRRSGRDAGEDTFEPRGIGLDRSREAASRYRGVTNGPFASCFVCALARAKDENCLKVYAGEIGATEAERTPEGGEAVVSTPWTPAAWTAAEDGRVREEIIWSALDCPTYFACFHGTERYPVSFLARFSAEVGGPIFAGEEYEVSAWQREVDGRKRRATSAIFSASGSLLARAEALWIEPR